MGGGKDATAGIDVRLTVQRLTRAARALVATAARRTACLHVSRAMQAARRREGFDFASRLGRRAEAGPRRVLPRVRPPTDGNRQETGTSTMSVTVSHLLTLRKTSISPSVSAFGMRSIPLTGNLPSVTFRFENVNDALAYFSIRFFLPLVDVISDVAAVDC